VDRIELRGTVFHSSGAHRSQRGAVDVGSKSVSTASMLSGMATPRCSSLSSSRRALLAFRLNRGLCQGSAVPD